MVQRVDCAPNEGINASDTARAGFECVKCPHGYQQGRDSQCSECTENFHLTRAQKERITELSHMTDVFDRLANAIAPNVLQGGWRRDLPLHADTWGAWLPRQQKRRRLDVFRTVLS